eukprot:GILJ01004512.1.p1 GENE.GILJ01004512.1~~GILJ01004512.1.p1  ORF type:complete len:874 (-),score=189.95 GILJ01004512.1:763-3384(-)
MDIEDIVRETDVAYEEEIRRNPFSLKLWWRYLDAKRKSPPKIRQTIYERSLKYLPGSYKLWFHYLKERREMVKGDCVTDPSYEAANNAHEKALVFMHKMPRIWLDYCEFLMAQGFITKTRRTFDRALRSLPITQHDRVWELYIKFADSVASQETAIVVYRRYLQLEPDNVEQFIAYLLSAQRIDEAAQLLAKVVNDEDFVSKEGKTTHQLWMELCELISKNPTKVTRLKCESIIRHGIRKFTDEVGHLWNALADFYIRQAQFEKARDVYEEGIHTVTTVRDFSLIYDAYTKFEEQMLSVKMEQLEGREDDDNEDEEFKSVSDDVDLRLERLDNLMNRRQELLSSVLLRQNPHNVFEWQKRVRLFTSDPVKVVQTYSEAVATVDPQKAAGKPHTLWVNWARVYEEQGALEDARVIFEKATHVNFKGIDDLATVWCEWAEMEMRHEKYDEALKVMRTAVRPPRGALANRDLVQSRVHKSVKLWSLYVDLEESLGTVDSTKAVYERMLDLKVATPQIVINYAAFLEEHKFFEESFKAYEKGINLFTWPAVGDLWFAYLKKFVDRYKEKKLERARDLFEQAVNGCPPEVAKNLYLMYADLEEKYGLTRHAMAIYERSTKAVPEEELMNMYTIYIAKASEYFGVTRTREIFERAIEALPDKFIRDMCIKFADTERKLGEIDRARAIYTHSSQYCNPKKDPHFWKLWYDFEVQHGNEDTFKEMLRIKRSVQQQYSQVAFNPQEFLEAQGLLPGQKPAAGTAAAAVGKRKLPTEMDMLEQQAVAVVEAGGGRQTDAVKVPSQATDMDLEDLSKAANPEEIDILEEGVEERTMINEEELDIEEKPVPSAVFGGLLEKVSAEQKKEEAPLGARERFKRRKME